MDRQKLIQLCNLFFSGENFQKMDNEVREKIWECIYAKLGVMGPVFHVFNRGVFLADKYETLRYKNFYIDAEDDLSLCTVELWFEGEDYRNYTYWGGAFKAAVNLCNYLEESELLDELQKPFEDSEGGFFCTEFFSDACDEQMGSDSAYHMLVYAALFLCHLADDANPYETSLNEFFSEVYPSFVVSGSEYIRTCCRDLCQYIGVDYAHFLVVYPLVLPALISRDPAVAVEDDSNYTNTSVSIIVSKHNIVHYGRIRELLTDYELRDALDRISEFIKFPFTPPTGNYAICGDDFISGYTEDCYVAAFYAPKEHDDVDVILPQLFLARMLFREGLVLAEKSISVAA